MKNKLLSDSIVYIISPILIFNFINSGISKYLILVLVSIIATYTIVIKKKESRINISGIIFSTIYITILLLRQNIRPGVNIYVYDTCCMIVLTLIIIFLLLLQQNIFKLMYIDIRKCKGDNNLRIFNNIRKANLDYDFKKISLIFTIHLVSLIFVRITSIYTLGFTNYEKAYIIQVILNIVFIMGEIYTISKLRANIPNNIKIKNKLSPIKKSPIGGRIIDIEKYKNLNK